MLKLFLDSRSRAKTLSVYFRRNLGGTLDGAIRGGVGEESAVRADDQSGPVVQRGFDPPLHPARPGVRPQDAGRRLAHEQVMPVRGVGEAMDGGAVPARIARRSARRDVPQLDHPPVVPEVARVPAFEATRDEETTVGAEGAVSDQLHGRGGCEPLVLSFPRKSAWKTRIPWSSSRSNTGRRSATWRAMCL